MCQSMNMGLCPHQFLSSSIFVIDTKSIGISDSVGIIPPLAIGQMIHFEEEKKINVFPICKVKFEEYTTICVSIELFIVHR